MKHLFKKGLSLFLAVLMVVSMLPVDALAVAFVSSDEDAPARREEPVLDVGDPIATTQADSISRHDRTEVPEVPDTGDEGDLPVDPFWTNVTLKAVLKDATSGEVEITAEAPYMTSDGLGVATLVLGPAFGNTTLAALAGGKITTDDSEETLKEKLQAQDGLGVGETLASLIYIVDVSSGSFKDGVWKHTATLGTSYLDYISKAASFGVSVDTGIPMQVLLASQGDQKDVCVADVEIRPLEAVLAVDDTKPDVVPPTGDGEDTIILPADATSFKFNVMHTAASNQDAEITDISWEGNNKSYVRLAGLVTGDSLTLKTGNTNVTGTLSYSVAGDKVDPYIGDVIITYRDKINTNARTLRVHVRTDMGVEPIHITVTAGGPAMAGAGTLPDTATNCIPIDVTDSDIQTLFGPGILDADLPAAGGITDASASDGITLTLADGAFKTWADIDSSGPINPDEFDPDAFIESAPWVAAGDSLGDLVMAAAGKDVKPGEYSAGSIKVPYIDADLSGGTLDIPIIVTVKKPDSFQAIFETNGGIWTAGDNTTTLNTHIVESTNAGHAGAAIDPSLLPPAPTRPNHTFQYWALKGDTAEKEVENPAYGSTAGVANRYVAIWKQDSTEYILKYNANAGTDTDTVDNLPEDQKGNSTGDSYTFDLVFDPAPTREGYKFAGWADSSLATSPDYTATGTTQATVVKDNNPKTVHAVWTPLYGVTYADDTTTEGVPQLGAKLPAASGKVYEKNDSATVTYAEGYAVNATVANDDGLVYKFTGWTRSDTGTLITATSLTMPGEDLTLTATWAPVMLNVTYDLQGGTDGDPAHDDSSVPATVQKGGTYQILAGDPTKENYDFLGWSTGTTGGQTTAVTGLKVNGTVSNVTADLTLTAEWERHQSTVTFLLDGGTLAGFTDGKLVRTGPTGTAMDAGHFPSGTPTKTGYTFQGWKNGSTEYDADNLPTYPADKGGNLNITATWTRDESFIVFDLAGGKIGESTDSVTKSGPTGTALADTEFPANPTKDGFTFTGWSDGYTAAGDTPKLPNFPDADKAVLTITAQWEAKGNAVRYLWNYTGAPSEGVYASESVKTNESPKGVADPERTGYDFRGWYTSTDCKDEEAVADVTDLTITAAVDLYAKWTPKKVQVVYHAVHGSDPASESVDFDTADHPLKAYNTINAGTGWTDDASGNHILTVTESDVQHVYRFDGWTRDDTNVVTKIDIDEEGPITVTATWTELFTVTYADATGAPATIPSGATQIFTVDSGATHTLFNADGSVASAPTMANGTGYTFVGWKAGTDDFDLGTADYTATGTKSFTVRSNVTLYPVWKINQYTVTFMQNHNSTDTTTLATKKTNYNTALGSGNFADAPSWTGYEFGGWYPNADGSGTKFTDATLVTADIPVYAKWKANVTYAWGDVTPAGVTKPTQEPVDVGGTFDVADTPNKTDIYLDASGKGYTFDGWSVVNNGGTPVLTDPEATVTVAGPVTLTGQWTAKKYPVTYIWGTGDKAEMKNTDGDKVDVPTQSNVQHGDKFTAATNTVTPNIYLDKAGKSWELIGWSVKMGEAAAVDKDLDAEITNVTAAVTLTARWQKVSYTVTYNNNYKKADGSAAGIFTTQTGISYGGKTTAPDPAPTRDNYQFAGWYKQTGCTTAVDFANDTITQDTTYYAKWTGQSKVEFDLNGGALADTLTDAEKAFLGEQTGVTGTKDTLKKPGATITAATLTRVGYSFQGWSTDNTATSATAAVNLDNVAFPDNAGDKVTYYAIWKINEYDITYVWGDHAPDGKNAPSDKVNHGDKHTVSDIVAVDTVYEETKSDETLGWIFKGWVVGSGDSAVTYKAGDEITNITAPVTLTAKWEAKMVTVTLDRNGHGPTTYGDPWSSDNKQTVQYGKTVALPDPTDTSYSFVNWTGTGGPYLGGATTAALKKDETFTANWQQGQSKIKFVANNGAWTGSADTEKSIQGNAGEAIPASGANAYPGTPARTGYTFAGWLSDETTPATYPADSLPNFPAAKDTTLTLTAQWTANKYKVTYDPGLAGTNVGAYIDLDDTTEGNQTEDAFTYDAATLKAKTADVVKWANAGDDTGWHFQNWLSDTTDGSKPYVAGAELGTNAKDYNFTLTAQWKIDVSYDANWPETDPAGQGGVSVPSTPAQIDPSGKLTTAQTAKPGDLTNWTFDGWYTTPNDTTETGVKVDTDTEFDKPATIYARWKANEYKVHFVDNNDEYSPDGNANPADQTGLYGDDITLPSAGTKTGYTFDGWYAEADLTNLKGDVGDDYTITIKPETTLYGKWSPVDVTVTYLNGGHGTAPSETTKPKYNATDYSAKAKDTITATAASGDGWNDDKTIFTVTEDGKQNRYRFDYWVVLDGDGNATTTTYNSGAAINPVNVTNGVVKKTTAGVDTYTLTLQAHWTALYSVIYEPGDHGAKGTQPAAQQNQPAGSFVAAQAKDVIDKADASDVWTGSLYEPAAGGHWVFTGWKTAEGTSIDPGKPVTTVDHDVVLTAQWKEQYKITLGAPVGTGLVASGSSKNYVEAKLNNIGKSTAADNDFLLVDKAETTTVSVSDLTLAGPNAGNYLFKNWAVDSDKGAFATTGGTQKDDTLTITGDVTITPHWLLKPTLATDHDHYHLNYKTDEAIAAGDRWAGTDNKLPKYTWTANNAIIGDIVLTYPDGSTETLTHGNQVSIDDTTTSGVSVITFERTFLLGLAKSDDYELTVNATTGTTATPTNAKLMIDVTPRKLLKVDIGVKDATKADYEQLPTPVYPSHTTVSTTAKVGDGTGTVDGVKYVDHKDTRITTGNLLTYDWYYGPTKPTQTDLNPNADPLAKTAVEALLPADKTLIGAGDTTGALAVTDAKYKGLYIYAVAVATGTGTGAVITNAIPVDYDAVVKVNQDGSAVTAPGHYRVWLVPTGVDPTVESDGSLSGAGVVEAKNGGTDNVYATDPSALTGGKTYNIYVNMVENDFTIYQNTNKQVSQQTAADDSHVQTVDFYSVHAVETVLKHATDGTAKEVGESFEGAAAKPTTGFMAGSVTVGDGTGVLTGTTVTAAASKAWGQDYTWQWGSDTGADAPASLTYAGTGLTTGNTGKDYVISAKSWIGGKLTQSTYAVTGDIKGTGQVASAVLTYTKDGVTYTFNGVTDGNPGDTVTFTVPKSGLTGGTIGSYTISATGAANPRTAVLGYSAPTADAPPQSPTPIAIAQVTGKLDKQFTIFIGASEWRLRAEDDHGKDGKTDGDADHAVAVGYHPTQVTASGDVKSGTDTTTWTKTFANYNDTNKDQKVYHITLSNTRNMPLDVKLEIVKTAADGTETTIYDSTNATATTVTDDNKVKIEDLAQSFTLEGQITKSDGSVETDKRVFTLTIPEDLDNDDDVTYSFKFTSMEKGSSTVYGPSVTYNLKLVVEPIPVKAVEITNVTGKPYSYTVDLTDGAEDITFKDGLDASKLNKTGTTASGKGTDVEYSWYAIPHGATASVSASGTVSSSTGTPEAVTTASLLSDGNRTIDLTRTYDYAGKDLVVVAHGVENATDYAISGSFPAPRQMVIELYHNADQQTGTDAPTGHQVFVVAKDGDFADAVEATWDGDKGGYTAAITTGAAYDIYANIVGGTAGDDAKNYQMITTVPANYDFTTNPKVVYHSVTINDTTVDNIYTGLTGSDYLTAAPTAKPTATVPDTADTPGTIAVTDGGWVVKGNDVTFTYPAWTKDYTLDWTGSVTATDANTTSGANAVHTLSNLAAAATVDTKLTLKLYEVTAYVIGNGTADYITLTSTGDENANVFTTQTGAPSGAILATTPSLGSITAAAWEGKNVTITVPKGTSYAVLAQPKTGTTVDGYHETHSQTAEQKDSITKAVAVNASSANAGVFDVLLSSKGIGLTVVDDDSGTPHSAGVTWEKGDALTDSVTHTETLDFGYGATKDIVLTLNNNSANDSAGQKQVVYNIIGSKADPDGSKVTWDSTTFTLADSGTSNALASLSGTDTSPTVKLTIPKGLTAGTYTYTATFTFSDAVDGATVGTLNYNLKIVVNPAKFDTVSMTYSDVSAALAANTVLAAGKDLALFDAETKAIDVFDDLKGPAEETPDYHYAWYVSTDGTLNKTDDLTWTPADGSVVLAGATALNVEDQALSHTVIDDHQGKYIYLVIYATASNGKVIEAAVSDPVRTGFQGVVQIKEDDVLQASEPKTAGETPVAKYTVTIVKPDNTELPTVWSDDLDGYVACDASKAPIYLDPALTYYTVKTSAYEGDTATTALASQTITAGTLGTSNIATAEYFTVTAVATTARHYVDAVGEDFGATMPKAKLTIGTTDVDGKTVLKGQNVAAKFDDLGSGVAWTQDYTLTWQDEQNNDATDGSGVTDVAGASGVTATDAVTGRTWTGISAKTYIGGRLDQKTYEIKGDIVGSGSLTHVVMTDAKDNENTTVKDGTINKNNKNTITDNSGSGTAGDAGDKITLFVVKGQYGLTAFPAANTTVRGIEWASDPFAAGDSVSGKDVPTGTTFTVYLDAASAVLRVQDTHTDPAAHMKDSDAKTPASNNQHADHTHEVFFHAMTDSQAQTVVLENRGNTDLTLDTPTIWKVDAGKGLTDVKWADWTNSNPVTQLGKDGAYSKPDVITITNTIPADHKTLAGAQDTNNDGTADVFDKISAATVSVDQKVKVADSGIYILRYTTGENGPVVYYVLNLVVKPLPITAVTTDTLSEAPGTGDKVQIKNYTGAATGFDKVMVDPGTGTSVAANTVTEPDLVDGTDVAYQWVKSATKLSATDVANKLSVDPDTGVITAAAGVTKLTDNGADSKQYTVQSGDLNSFLYLVAYAPGAGLNASELAVSDPITTKETVEIQVTVNTQVQNLADNQAPGYTIKLLPATDPDNYIPTSWNPGAVANDPATKFYTAAIDTTKSYKIYAETYKGGGTLVDTGLTLGDGATAPKAATVPYFTVNFTENLAVDNGTIDGFKSYLPGGLATDTNAIQDALSVAVSDDKQGTTDGTSYTYTLPASGTPVLSGMNVKVTVNATQKNGNTTEGVVKSWKDAPTLHTLSTNNWSDAVTGKSSKIEYAEAISSGDIKVDGSKTFSASLAPVTFTVEFNVKDVTDPKNTDTNITTATLSRNTAKEPGATGFADITASSITNDGKDGAKVTFTGVPVGELVIAATGNPVTKTRIVGYTWNNADADPVDPGEIVVVTTDEAKNKHAGNVIQIQRATNLVQWMDNFNKADATVLSDFVNSKGFERVDAAGVAVDRSLPEGYNATTHTLTYMARVKNVGTTPLEGFRIQPSELSGVNLEFELSAAKVYNAAGQEKADAGDVTSVSGILLLTDEYVQFPVTIVPGQPAKRDPYNTAKFTASCTNGDGLPANVSVYQPAYQVKSVIEATQGGAEMFYGTKDFDTTAPATVTQVGVSGGFTGQNFAYALLSESELTAYLDGDARKDNVYTTDGFEDNGVTGHKVPDWLVIDPATGAISVDATKSDVGKGVHVQKTTGDSGELVEVNDELVVYVKVTSTDDARLKKIVPFTVNMKTSPLKVVTANTANTAQKTLDGDAYRALYSGATTATPYPGQGEDIAHGAKVLLEYFNYTQVENRKNTDDVLDNNGHPAYAAGANRWNGAEGADNSSYGAVTKGHWDVAPKEFDGTGSTQYDPAGGATNSRDYTFTYYYDGTGDVDQYDYADTTIDLTIPALVPALSLKFADTVKNYDAVKSVLKADQAQYSAPGANADKSPLAALDYSIDAWRKDESITYLDTEPVYTVKLQQLGVIYGLTLTEKDKDGFAVVGGLPTELTFDENGELSFDVKMTHMNSNTQLWAGTHTITFEASGYRTEDMTGEPVKATYVLNVTVEPKPIAKAYVTGPDAPTPEGTPDKTVDVDAYDDNDTPLKDFLKEDGTDDYGNTPITPTVTWTDKDGNEVETFTDGEEYTDTVVLTPDPNYTFEDKTPPADEPNYTKNGKTDENDDPTKVDEDLTITVTPEKEPAEPDRNKEVKFEHKTLLPKKALLKFDDVKTADTGVTTTDVTVPADGSANENYKRTVTVVRGQQLGEYTINLGAYDNTVTDVKLTEVNGLPTEGLVWSLAPATLDHPLDAVNGDPAGAKQSYTLDLRGIDTAKLSTTADYTLVLTAKGCDDYAPDADHPNVTATYTLTVKVLPAPTPVLKFHDVKQDGADTTDEVEPDGNANENYKRTVTVQREKTLGKYVIDLSAFTNLVKGVSVTKTTDTLPNGTAWEATFPDTVGDMNAGDQKTYAVLDLSDVYTVELDTETTYTVKLTAAGTDLNNETVTATYTLDIKVTPATPSQLMVKDLLKAGTGAGTENVIAPAENVYAKTYTRDITVKWDKDSGWWYPLGTYDLDVGASGNAVRDIVLTSDSDLSSASVEALSAVCAGTKLEKLALDKGGTWSFALDLSDVDYTKLNTDETDPAKLPYVTLTATGKDLNGTTVTATYKLTLKFEAPPKPELKFDDVKQGGTTNDPATTGPEVNDTRSVTATEGAKLGKYTIYLGAYNAGVKVTSITSTRSPNLVYDVTPDCTTLTPTLVERKGVDDAQAFELDLTGMETKVGTYTLTLVAQGVDMSGKYTANASYTLTIKITPKGGSGGGGGGGVSCPNQVTYLLGLYGTTKDSTMEMVSGKSVKSVPNVSALEGYKFLGWSLTGPTGNAEQDAKRTLVDPKSVAINGDTTFYAVYQVLYKVPQPPVHKHYVIGYPNGNFGPADNINRASVATIIARAVLPNFVEGADYGNPGGYSDVDGHWAASAIAYCSKYGVFKGYDDGTFRPDRPISRQELALVMARLSGVKSGSAPFSDISTAGDWAKDGIYTAYANGWVNGYTDGTFKPLNPIRRDETVKIFNAYLGRGVDAEGLSTLTEYVHTGVASNVTENGTTEYMTWPDVTKDQWAYYEIIEAANDHEFEVDTTQPKGYAVPETWTKCWIDEKWRYHDDANDGGPSAVVSALPRKRGAAD